MHEENVKPNRYFDSQCLELLQLQFSSFDFSLT